MEYERIPVSKYTNVAIPYEGEYGICELLREFAQKDNWDYIQDENYIIGLKKLHETIRNFHHTPKRVEALKQAIQRDAAGRAHSVEEEITFALENAAWLSRRPRAFATIPQGHCALLPSFRTLPLRIMRKSAAISTSFT